MDFIHYNSAEVHLVTLDDSSEEIDYNNLLSKYGQVETVSHFDTISQLPPAARGRNT
jgi:hypothetical protein